MKVLLTGFTAAQAGASKIGSYWDTALVLSALRTGNHEVDHRPVVAGEKLDGYDVAVIGQQKLCSMVSFTHRYGALWTGSKLPSLLYYEDTAKAPTAYLSAMKPSYAWNYPTEKFCNERLAEIRADAKAACGDAIDETIRRWATPGKATAFIIAHSWGNFDILRKHFPADTRRLDLTSFYDAEWSENLTHPDDVHPERRWMFATLVAEKEWRYDPRTYCKWPVDSHGWPAWAAEKGSTLGKGGHRGQKMTRHELQMMYMKSWGVLTWPYKSKSCGSGIWRDRFLDAINAKRVAWFNPEETAGLGRPYSLMPEEIEAMTDDQLKQLAADQAGTFMKYQLPPVSAADGLTELLHETIKGL
jgi:hypothetical protein